MVEEKVAEKHENQVDEQLTFMIKLGYDWIMIFLPRLQDLVGFMSANKFENV